MNVYADEGDGGSSCKKCGSWVEVMVCFEIEEDGQEHGLCIRCAERLASELDLAIQQAKERKEFWGNL